MVSTSADAIIEGQIVETEKGEIVGTGKGQKEVEVEFNPNDDTGGVNEIVGGRKRHAISKSFLEKPVPYKGII